jgi:hypothetical protein
MCFIVLLCFIVTPLTTFLPATWIPYLEFTVVRKENIHDCKFVNLPLPTNHLAGRLLVYSDDLFIPDLFKKCVTDEFANGVFFATMAQDVGAMGVITRISYQETEVHCINLHYATPLLNI